MNYKLKVAAEGFLEILPLILYIAFLVFVFRGGK